MKSKKNSIRFYQSPQVTLGHLFGINFQKSNSIQKIEETKSENILSKFDFSTLIELPNKHLCELEKILRQKFSTPLNFRSCDSLRDTWFCHFMPSSCFILERYDTF